MNANAIPLKPKSLMLDTCIWVNSQIGTNNGHEAARDLIVTARKQGMILGIAPHSLANVFYIVHRHLRRLDATSQKSVPGDAAAAAKETAWAVISNILDYATVIGADGSDARIAELHKAIHDDFEDDLIIASARRMNADLVVTDDLSFINHSPLPTMTAKDSLRWILST